MSDRAGPKWYLVSDGLVSKLLCEEEHPKLMCYGGPWTSMTCGYDTEQECREKQGISDRPCMECGNIFGTNYSTPIKEQLRALNICFTCNHWRKYFLRKDDMSSVVVLGHHYRILPPESGQAHGLKGHGGRVFHIRFLPHVPIRGGVTVTTDNLWSQGIISPTWRERLPDNAEFLQYPVVERICCSECERLYDLKSHCQLAVTRVLGGLGEESNCQFCGEPNGGACINTVTLFGDRAPLKIWGPGRTITLTNGRRLWMPWPNR